MPCDAAPRVPGMASESAPRHTSATRWLTSTFPAPTAAGGRAATIVPAGAMTSTGRNAPPLAGIVGSVATRRRERDRRDSDRLDRVHVAGALWVGAREVERDAVTGHSDGDHDARRTLLIGGLTGRVDDVLERPCAVAHRSERGAHPPLAVREHLLDGLSLATSSASRLAAEDVRPDLRVEVAAPLVGRA